jgi:hypothetical protein
VPAPAACTAACCCVLEHTNLKVATHVVRVGQEMIETYLRPLRAHDWDRGALLSFRAMKRPEALPYEAVTQPVLLVIGSQDSMLLKSTHKVRLHSRQRRVWGETVSSLHDAMPM